MADQPTMRRLVEVWRGHAPEHRAMVLRTLRRDRTAAHDLYLDVLNACSSDDDTALVRRLLTGVNTYDTAIAILEGCRG